MHGYANCTFRHTSIPLWVNYSDDVVLQRGSEIKVELPIVEKSAIGQRKDFNRYTLCEKLFDPLMIVDICSLRSARCFVPSHSGCQRARGLTYIFDLAIAYECIKNVLLAGVPNEFVTKLAIFQNPMTSRLKTNL